MNPEVSIEELIEDRNAWINAARSLADTSPEQLDHFSRALIVAEDRLLSSGLVDAVTLQARQFQEATVEVTRPVRFGPLTAVWPHVGIVLPEVSTDRYDERYCMIFESVGFPGWSPYVCMYGYYSYTGDRGQYDNGSSRISPGLDEGWRNNFQDGIHIKEEIVPHLVRNLVDQLKKQAFVRPDQYESRFLKLLGVDV